MYQEQVAKLTAEHLRLHLSTYLSELETEFTGSDKLRLSVPEVSTQSLVGGVIQTDVDSMPIVAIDCLDKSAIPSSDSLFYSQYEGAIASMVSGNSSDIVDRRIKRYSRAIEHFVKEHQLFHEDFSTNTKPFSFRELVYVGSRFSGSIELGETEETPRIWVAGMVIDVLWITSEDGARQH